MSNQYEKAENVEQELIEQADCSADLVILVNHLIRIATGEKSTELLAKYQAKQRELMAGWIIELQWQLTTWQGN
jgi:hypothetical protein